MKAQIVELLERNGYDTGEILAYWACLDADKLDPAVAYFSVDSCFWHSSSTVLNWLQYANMRGRHSTDEPARRSQEIVTYLTELRRRSLKSRREWVEKRHEWTNQINRAKHYAGKFYREFA